jgi:phosphate-selective porin OprO/OprP
VGQWAGDQADNLLRFQMNISGRGHSQHAGRSLLISSVFLQAKEEVLERLPALGKENKENTASNSQNGLYLDRSFNGLRWDSGTSEIRINSFLPPGAPSASGSNAGSPTDQFFLRQAQPVLAIRFEKKYGFHIKPVLGTTSGILDAYLESNYRDSFRIRVGRFMPSFGRESLPPVTALAFNERAFPTNNMPIREIGGQIHGEVLGRKAEYQVGVFSGPAVDSSGSGSSVAGYDNSIDFSGRLSARPFQDSGLNLARGLGLGVAFDYQTPHSQTGPGNWGLPVFRSPGQKSFVSNSYDAYAGWGGERISPGSITIMALRDACRIYPFSV